MRLDKFLCDMNIGSRSQVKSILKTGQVIVNEKPVRDPSFQIRENKDKVIFQGKALTYQKYFYYMLNKPSGYVSATTDSKEKTVMALMHKEDLRSDLFPAGRLDKDTEGLLLLTNDGELAHRLLSPGKHVDKTYLVTIEHSLSEKDITALEQGVDIGEAKPTLPGKVSVIDTEHILLTIHQGKYHQVKRMLNAVGNHVIHLKRITFAGISLDKALAPGEYRPLTEEEVAILYGNRK